MNDKWSKIQIGKFLEARQEKPQPEKISSGEYSIVSKISFANGQMEFRDHSKTNTNMITIMPGDLVVSGINAGKGAIAIYNKTNKKPASATIHYSSYSVDDKLADIEYLWLFFRSEVFREILRLGLPNGIKTELRPKKFLALEIPLPPLSEQKCIVKKIKEIEEKLVKIQNERKAITEPLNFIAGAYLDSIILKQKWPKERLDKVAKINPSKSEIKNIDINTEVSFVPMSVVDDIDGLIKNPEIKELKDVKKGYTYFAEGDVIFAKITPCMENGKSAIGKNLKNKLGFGSTEFHVVRPSKKILSEWIHLIFRNPSFRKEAEENMPGTAGQKRVPKKFLEEYKIPMPSVDIQKKVLLDMKNFQFKIDELGMEQSKSKLAINALMPSILNKAFAGEL